MPAKLLSCFLILFLLASITQPAQADQHLPQTGQQITANSLVIEGDFIYLAGEVSGHPLSTGQAGGMKDLWLLKMDRSGAPIYQLILGGSEDDTASALVVHQGVVYLAGETWSEDFPGAPGSAGEDDALLLAVAPDGSQVLWAQRFGGSDQDSGRALALWQDSLYLAGITWSPDLVPGAAKGDADGFLARLNLDGSRSWLQVFGGRGLDVPHALETDAQGLWMAGQTFSADFGGASPGAGDAFAALYRTDGTQQWVRKYGGRQEDAAYGLALTADGGFALAGGTQSGDLPGALGTFGGQVDAFLMQMSPSGEIRSTRYLGGDGVEYALDVLPLPGGELLVAGSTTSASFPMGASLSTPSLGGEDAFLVRLKADGELAEIWRKGGPGDDRATRLGLSTGGLWLAGTFSVGSLPYALQLEAGEISSIPLPAAVPPQPTATLAFTATPRPTETLAPTLAPEAAISTPTSSAAVENTPAPSPVVENPLPSQAAEVDPTSTAPQPTPPSPINSETPAANPTSSHPPVSILALVLGFLLAAGAGGFWLLRRKRGV